jgi:hypothetical protein
VIVVSERVDSDRAGRLLTFTIGYPNSMKFFPRNQKSFSSMELRKVFAGLKTKHIERLEKILRELDEFEQQKI